MTIDLTREELETIVHALHGHAIHAAAHKHDNHKINELAAKVQESLRKPEAAVR